MTKNLLVTILILFILKQNLKAFGFQGRGKTCFGKHQMGLDKDLDIEAHQFEPIEFINFDLTPSESILMNNGHFLQIDLNYNDTVPTIKVNFESSLGVQGVFRLHNLYFHWFKQVPNSLAHENFTFPAAFHAIFYDVNAKSFPHALAMNKSTIILAFEIKVNPLPPHNFDVLQENLQYVRISGYGTPIENLNLEYWLKSEMENFYSYEGGLFDFVCDGTVIWLDYFDILSIAPEIVKEFRKLKASQVKALMSVVGETRKPKGKIFQNDLNLALGQSPPFIFYDLEEKAKSAARNEMAEIKIITKVGILVLISWLF